MELHIKVSTNVYEGFELEESIAAVDDAEKIGQRVGRAVRDWIREVPITNSGRHLRLEVDARWHNGAKPAVVERAATTNDKPARRRKRLRSKS